MPSCVSDLFSTLTTLEGIVQIWCWVFLRQIQIFLRRNRCLKEIPVLLSFLFCVAIVPHVVTCVKVININQHIVVMISLSWWWYTFMFALFLVWVWKPYSSSIRKSSGFILPFLWHVYAWFLSLVRYALVTQILSLNFTDRILDEGKLTCFRLQISA